MSPSAVRLALALLVLSPALVFSAERLSAGIGLNYNGAQLELRLDRRWLAELRYLTGASEGAVAAKSQAYGLRASRLFGDRDRLLPYMGCELAGVSLTTSASGRVSGLAAGAFLGVDLGPAKRVRLRFDGGPYALFLDKSATGRSQGSMVFVANSALVFYFY